MSGNARGKLKEEMEGIHRNIDWVRVHAQKSIALLGDAHPEMVEMFNGLITAMDTLDEMTLKVYATL
jgi:hypothetical protein